MRGLPAVQGVDDAAVDVDAEETWINRGAGASVTSVSEGEMTRRAIQREEPLVVELREFARAVVDGAPAPVSAQDGMIALLLARKMVESALSGEVIAGGALEAALS